MLAHRRRRGKPFALEDCAGKSILTRPQGRLKIQRMKSYEKIAALAGELAATGDSQDMAAAAILSTVAGALAAGPNVLTPFLAIQKGLAQLMLQAFPAKVSGAN